MTLATVNTADEGRAFRHLDNITITNQTANSTAVTQAIQVPLWASSVSWYITITNMSGTTPLFDFELDYADFGTSPPTLLTTNPKLGNAGLTVTQVTAHASGGTLITIDVGPAMTTDTTGSATASCYYAVNCYLPPYILYTYTTDGTTDDEDYAFTINCLFRP